MVVRLSIQLGTLSKKLAQISVFIFAKLAEKYPKELHLYLQSIMGGEEQCVQHFLGFILLQNDAANCVGLSQGLNFLHFKDLFLTSFQLVKLLKVFNKTPVAFQMLYFIIKAKTYEENKWMANIFST